MRPQAVLVLAFVAAVAPRPARAETGTLRIDYAADPRCPDERRFIELAKERVRVWPAIAEPPDLIARARTREEGGVFVGKLALEDAAGRSLGSREIREGSCDDVVLALALFLAVALEADAEATPPPSTPERESRTRAGVPAPGLAPKAKTAKLPSATSRDGVAWYAVADVLALSGRTPNLAAGVSLGVELRPRAPSAVVPSAVVPSAVVPSAVVPYGSLRVDAAPYSTVERGRGHVVFSWGAVVVAACVAFERFRQRVGGGRWEPWGCARFEGGGLRASSHGYASNRADLRTWLAVGPEVGIVYWWSRRVGVSVGGGVSFPLVRQNFVLSGATLFRGPAVAVELALGVKLRVW